MGDARPDRSRSRSCPGVWSSIFCDLPRLLLRGLIRYGWAVSVIPIPRSRHDEDALIEALGTRSLAKSGVREIEAFLKHAARSDPPVIRNQPKEER